MRLYRFCTRILISCCGILMAHNHAIAQTPRYVITLGAMQVWNGVAHSTDTDYLSLSVRGPSGDKFARTFGPNNLHKGDRTDWQLSSTPIAVPANDQFALTIAWAAANTGTPDTQKASKAMSDAAEAIGQASANPYTVIISTVVGEVVGHFLQDCDTPLFGDKIALTGAQLAAGLSDNTWSAEGPNEWHAVFDYPDISSRCDTGHYNLEVHIKRVDPAPDAPAVNKPQAQNSGQRADFRKNYSLGYRDQTWHVIVGSFYSEADAEQRANLLNQEYPNLFFEEAQSNSRQLGDARDIWMVTLGSGIGKSDADYLQQLARNMPVFSDAYEYCWGVGPADPGRKCLQ
jgi:hypothetical protein